ncbi:hypothetical protein MASSI9I_50554 [Massilia sp. 9I]|nr:hypothetical protein MASSI9I_50554 [Massilia sp. 9I]
MFAIFPDAALINFKAVSTDLRDLHYPVQQYRSKHTFVIDLPQTPDEYLARIGKTTRASLRQQMNTLKRVFPSFSLKCMSGQEIDLASLRAITEFSEQRINARGVRLRHDIARMAELCTACGFVVMLLIDGRMCAGSINYRVGSGFFGDVTCYDPAYQKYGLGKLCTYFTVCESIRRGGRKFYLGGGEFDFKERMLGKRVDMDQVHIYRSYRRAFASPRSVATAFVEGQCQRCRTMLHERKDGALAKLAFNLLQAYRNRIAK